MVNETQPATPIDHHSDQRGRRRMDLAQKATVVSAWLAAVSAVITLLAWWLPRTPPDATSNSGPDPVATQAGPPQAPTTTAPTAAPSGPAAAVRYLDGMTPQAAGRNIVTVPRTVRNKTGYTSHPVAIQCPSNQTGDETSNVTYLLSGRYLQLDLTVRPHYPADADQRSVTYVLADVGVREIDGEMTTREAGSQKRATPAAPGSLTADVEGAQELTLKIACDDPRGVVVLTDARLTVAD